jgi:DNA-binding protein Fis
VKDQMETLIAQLVESGVFFTDAVSEFEKRFIRKVLDSYKGNQSQSAKALGIHRNTLGRKMEEYSMNGKNGASAPVNGKKKQNKKRR